MNKKILIIEDEEDIITILNFILVEAGYTVFADSSGKEIFNMISSFNPDLILLDLFLPEIDGREICKAIKADENTSHIPVIVISGAPDIYNTIMDACANDVVEKPFEVNVLLSRIERQLLDTA